MPLSGPGYDAGNGSGDCEASGMTRLFSLILLWLLLTAPMLWHVVSADVLLFQACSKVTCGPMDEKASPLHGTFGGIAAPMAIAESAECRGKCSNLEAAGKHVHIMGNYRTVMCQAWGGMFCVYGGEK